MAVEIQVVGFGINAGSPINRVHRALNASPTDCESIAISQIRRSSNGNENAMNQRRDLPHATNSAGIERFLPALHHRESQKKAASCRDR